MVTLCHPPTIPKSQYSPNPHIPPIPTVCRANQPSIIPRPPSQTPKPPNPQLPIFAPFSSISTNPKFIKSPRIRYPPTSTHPKIHHFQNSTCSQYRRRSDFHKSANNPNLPNQLKFIHILQLPNTYEIPNGYPPSIPNAQNPLQPAT